MNTKRPQVSVTVFRLFSSALCLGVLLALGAPQPLALADTQEAAKPEKQAEEVRLRLPPTAITHHTLEQDGEQIPYSAVAGAIEPRDGVSTWHADVRYYAIRDRDGREIAGFYLDPFARPGKRGGAWMDDCISRKGFAGTRVVPVAQLVCNFTPPPEGQPAQLTHNEVVTLFHEFGHGLHFMLTTVDYPSIGGISGVPWDAVELPSQFMEQYAWRPEVLPLISAHAETGEPLPADLLQRLLTSRVFHAGLAAVRQLEFALFDFRLHAGYDPARGARVGETLGEVRREVAVVRFPEFNRFAHAFMHIFSGGYAAGYYSYKWAEVLAADAFAAFEDTGVFDSTVAMRFLDSILSRGGSRDAMEAFVEFRGRRPDVAPLLRKDGIAA